MLSVMGFICSVGAQLPHAHSHRAGPGGKWPEHLKSLPFLTSRTAPPRADESLTPPCLWSPVSPYLPDPDETLVAASRIAAVESGCLPLATAAPVFWGIFLSWSLPSLCCFLLCLPPSPRPPHLLTHLHQPHTKPFLGLSWASPTRYALPRKPSHSAGKGQAPSWLPSTCPEASGASRLRPCTWLSWPHISTSNSQALSKNNTQVKIITFRAFLTVACLFFPVNFIIH